MGRKVVNDGPLSEVFWLCCLLQSNIVSFAFYGYSPSLTLQQLLQLVHELAAIVDLMVFAYFVKGGGR